MEIGDDFTIAVTHVESQTSNLDIIKAKKISEMPEDTKVEKSKNGHLDFLRMGLTLGSIEKKSQTGVYMYFYVHIFKYIGGQ